MNFLKFVTASLAGLAMFGSLALAPAFAQTATTTQGTELQTVPVTVNVNAGGHVTVRGATVTGVSGDIISATTSWGSQSLSWSVGVAASTTRLLGRKEGRVALTDVKNGDVLNFQGPLDMTAGNLTVNAQVVRDMSLAASGTASVSSKTRVFQGRIESVSANSLTIREGKKTVTVSLTGSATVEKKDFSAETLDTLQVGDHVRIAGLATGSTTIDASIVRDTSR